jgi:TP901 family phage tail tape measure protein
VDKRVAVLLDAVTAKYEAGMFRAASVTKAFAANAEVQIAKVGQAWDGFSGSSSKNLEKVGRVGLVVGGGVALALGAAAYAAMNFDKQMSEVGAVAGATGDQLDQLRQAALDAGQATVFSASEAAQAEAELAKAGVSTADIIGGGLTGALNLASAGGLDLATAATYAANAMATFKLQGADVPRIADTLAAGANKSAADVDQMGQSLQQTGLVADQMGLTLEDTVGTLSMFAQAGLKGSDAGTSLKTMLMRLTPSTKEAKDAMESLGLSFYDSEGNFVGISNAAEQLKTKLGPLTQEQRQLALQTIFGSDAIRAATILYQSGGQGVDEWTDAVSESGYAAELAAKKNDNLAGDLEQLRGSIETALIEGGDLATGALRGLTQALTGVVNGLGEMPAPLQAAFLGATGLLGVGASAIGIYGTLKPKIDTLKASLMEMGPAAQFAARNLGTMTIATAGVGIALAGLSYLYSINAQKAAEQQARAEGYTSAIERQTGALQDNINTETARQFAQGSVGKLVRETTADVELFGRAIASSGDEIESLSDQARTGRLENFEEDLRKGADAGSELATELLRLKDSGELSTTELMSLAKALDESSDALDEGTTQAELNKGMKEALTGADQTAAAAEGELAGQVGMTADAFADAEKEMRDAVSALKDWYDQVTAQLSADIAYQESLDSITESVKDNKTNLDINTEAGRANVNAFIDAKNAIIDYGIEMINGGASIDSATFATMNLVGGLRDTMLQAGYTEAEVADYLTRLGLTPEQIHTQFNTPGLIEARGAVEGYKNQVITFPRYVVSTFDANISPAEQAIRRLFGLKSQWEAQNDLYSRGIGLPPRAAGGPVQPWSAYKVHDTRAPELLSLRDGTSMLLTGESGGVVTNLSDPASMARSAPYMTAGGPRAGGDVYLTVHAQGLGSPAEIEKVLMGAVPKLSEAIRKADRSRT